MLEGKRLYSINIYDDRIELHVTGGVMQFHEKNDIAQIKAWIMEAKRIGVKAIPYVRYKINEEW